ncbi:MAG TPA: ribbon-helix-helix protein, CopG family [Solirubrobacteraceae bacterium]|nr:ribbon-helix-helix protein, CopG family [Solirubrobacteraceae bacterium]HME04131.1 ribbon-helix-helix protein, CopG family [Solirubrobacteraceae bacterium]
MRRTTISLPDDLAQALEREARKRHVSGSEVARTALEQHLGLSGSGPRELTFAGLGRSGHRSTARDMERLLEQEWSDEPGRR